jgi:hypothetical protein
VKSMAEIEILPQKIVDTRTIILKSKLDSSMVRLQGEKLKTSFFVRFRFLKLKPSEILLVSFSKYYEPYIVIGGKYSIDYCKRHNYALKVEDRTQAIFIDGKQLKPEPMSLEDKAKVIRLVGEEHSHYENETYVILDRMLQEVSSDNLFFAPFENEFETQPTADFDLRKPQISLEEEITFLRSKVARRPADVAEIIRENFEINERTLIYSPVYELTYKNMKNGKNVTALINGITGGVVLAKFDVQFSRKVGDPRVSESLPVVQKRFFRVEPEQPRTRGDAYVSLSPVNNATESLVVKEKVPTVVDTPPQASSALRFNAENVTTEAANFMTRLGYKQNDFPNEMYLDSETDVVELQLPEGTARVQIDPRNREVKAYEIQEESRFSFSRSKMKLITFLSSITLVVVALKLANIF